MVNKILSRNDILKKEVIINSDFNMNLLDFKQNKKFKKFFNIRRTEFNFEVHGRDGPYLSNNHAVHFHQHCTFNGVTL